MCNRRGFGRSERRGGRGVVRGFLEQLGFPLGRGVRTSHKFALSLPFHPSNETGNGFPLQLSPLPGDGESYLLFLSNFKTRAGNLNGSENVISPQAALPKSRNPNSRGALSVGK